MDERITQDNFRVMLSKFCFNNYLESPKVAKRLKMSPSTWNRLLKGESCPTEKTLKSCGLMFEMGFEKFSKLSKAEEESLSEKLGSLGGGVVGLASIKAAIAASGSVAGLSAAGVTSGLAGLGGLVGGGMVAGVATAALIPVAAGTSGFFLIKLLKHGITCIDRYKNKLDPRFEKDWPKLISE